MARLHRAIPALILGLGCAFLLRSRLQVAVPLARPLTNAFPVLPGYRTEDRKLTDEERSVAGMTEYIARVYYRDTTLAFSTLVSYYARQTQGKTIHSPRNCLPGAGWEIMAAGTQVVTVDGRAYSLNRDVLRNGGATALVYYWYQGRGRVTANEYAVKWNLLRDAALVGHTEEALVRVVVPIPASAGPALSSAAALAPYDSQATTIATSLIKGVSQVVAGGLSSSVASRGTARDGVTRFLALTHPSR